jgi:hypothetical protein
MAILTIGRVGLDDAIELNHPSEFEESVALDDRGRQVIFRGFLKSTTLANAKALRSEMLEQQGKLVACTYSGDDSFDGFYVLSDVAISSVGGSYKYGYFPFEVILIRIGSETRTELQSLLTGGTVTNSHSTVPVQWHAVPPGTLAYNAGSATPTEHSRTAVSGEMGVLLGIDLDEDPGWSIPPANYYDGSVKLYTQGDLRAGQDFRNDPADWSLENELVRIRPVTFQGSSTGRLDWFFWSTSWSSAVRFKVRWQDTTDIPAWHYMTCIRNDPDRHELDIALRRGAVFAACYYKYTGANSTHAVARDSVDAATAGTGYIKDSSLISGHRWVLGTPQAHTQDLTNGKITPTISSKFFKFYIGAAIDDAANGSDDGPDDIRDQYTGWASETVRAVRR